MAVEALDHQKLDEARALFQKSMEQISELPTGSYYAGLTWEKKEEPARAVEADQKASELKPDYAQVHSRLGLLYWRGGDQTHALDEFHRSRP
jgi:tetratricopeptide (TPR) repeat protein